MTLFEIAYTIAAGNHGILTANDARNNGIASKDLARWVNIGRFVKLGHGVYKSTHYPNSEEDPFAVACAQCGRGAYLCGESVLAMLKLMPASIDRIHVRIPRRLRRRLPSGCIASQGAKNYVPDPQNGIPCQKIPDAIRECVGTHMNERLAAAARSAYANGLIGKKEMLRLQKELSNA